MTVRAVLILALASEAAAQGAQQSTPASEPDVPSLWLTAGAGSTTVKGHCQFCEEESEFRHAASVVVALGRRVNRRMDVGGEVLWAPLSNPAGGTVNTVYLTAVAQFRPWGSKGLFIRGGAGMAFIRNWLVDLDTPNLQKALAVHIGGGWAFRVDKRVGSEFFAIQHAAALGDFETSDGTVENVLGNYWSLGAALVIR